MTSGWRLTRRYGARGATDRAGAREIALLKNTSEGLATVAMGLDWRAGDRIVAFREEFPANQYPWQRLEAKGVRIEWLSAADPLDKIDEAAKGARLLALSFVQFLTGHRADLNAIGEICHRRGAIFVVDAIQGLGVFPLDVREPRSAHSRRTGTSGCSGRRVARFSTSRRSCRSRWSRWSSAGPTRPITATTGGAI